MEPHPSAPRSPTLPPSLLIVDDDVGFVHAAAELARLSGFTAHADANRMPR